MILFLQERVRQPLADLLVRYQDTALAVFRLCTPMDPYPGSSRHLHQHRQQLPELRTLRHLHFVYQCRNKAVRILQCRCDGGEVFTIDTYASGITVFHRIERSSNCLSGSFLSYQLVVHIRFIRLFPVNQLTS